MQQDGGALYILFLEEDAGILLHGESNMKHSHTYESIRTRPGFYRCIHPDCSHYINRIYMQGKRAQCKCGNTFLLTSRKLQLKKPHCDDCTKGARIIDKLEERIETILGI